jgi:hypothetical protein
MTKFDLNILCKVLKASLIDENTISINSHFIEFGDSLTIDGIEYGNPQNMKSLMSCITRSQILGNVNYENLSFWYCLGYHTEVEKAKNRLANMKKGQFPNQNKGGLLSDLDNNLN